MCWVLVRGGWQQLQSLGASAVDALAAPFQGIADAASSAWNRITTTAAGAWSGLQSMAQRARQWMKAPFAGLATAASSAWNRVKAATSGAWEAVGSKVAGLARTAGRAGRPCVPPPPPDRRFWKSWRGGIAQASTAPSRAIAGALKWINEGAGRVAAPAMLTGTLALMPVVAGQVPQAGTPILGAQPMSTVTRPVAPSQGSRLLAETRGGLTPSGGRSTEPADESVRSILGALLGKLDALADRPIDVSVTTLLDGRQVAQSVYRDIREGKIKNYENAVRPDVKRIFVCSRYAGDTANNVAVAERLCRKAIEAGHAPFAPHLRYTRFLDDRDPSERVLGIACGLTFMAVCDKVWVYTAGGLSGCMGRELDQAFQLGKPVVEIKEV